MVPAEEWNHPDDRGVILAFDLPGETSTGALLEIYHQEESAAFEGLSLQFRVEDLDQFFSFLPAGIQSEGPKDRPWGARYLYLRDPNGILVIVYEGCL